MLLQTVWCTNKLFSIIIFVCISLTNYFVLCLKIVAIKKLNWLSGWRLFFSPTRCAPGPAPDREWGEMRQNGTWTGMVGEIFAGRGDLITTTLDNTLTRSHAVDFLIPIYVSRWVSCWFLRLYYLKIIYVNSLSSTIQMHCWKYWSKQV